VYTGDGKGKTTAALGLALRARGQGLRVGVIQFIKASRLQSGEAYLARELGIEWHQAGDGFTWNSKDLDESARLALAGWRLAQEKIASPDFDLIVLDEFTYPLNLGWLPEMEALAWLRENRRPDCHLVITGREASQALVAWADLVTEMRLVKHPFELGVKAQAGIEF
jgi:cob(I)alamin adenosyltransferase